MSPHVSAGFPGVPLRPWQRTALLLLGIAVAMTGLTGRAYLRRPQELLVYFGLVSLYTVGLWLTSGYSVTWLDRYVT